MEENGGKWQQSLYPWGGGGACKHMYYTVPAFHLPDLDSNGVSYSASKDALCQSLHSHAISVSLMCEFGGHA